MGLAGAPHGSLTLDVAWASLPAKAGVPVDLDLYPLDGMPIQSYGHGTRNALTLDGASLSAKAGVPVDLDLYPLDGMLIQSYGMAPGTTYLGAR